MAKLDFLCSITERCVDYALKKSYQINYQGTLPKGPYVLFSKHQTWLDQFLIGGYIRSQTRRFANYVMRRFTFPFNYIMTLYGGINVARAKEITDKVYSRSYARELNARAIRKAVDVLRNGEPLVMFPEGTRGYKTMNTRLKMRVAEEIIRENIPKIQFIPFGIEVEDIKKPNSQIWLRAGQPFYTEKLNELEKTLLKEIQILSNV